MTQMASYGSDTMCLRLSRHGAAAHSAAACPLF